MKYNSPKEIGIGDVVTMKDDTGYVTEHLVITITSKAKLMQRDLHPNLILPQSLHLMVEEL